MGGWGEAYGIVGEPVAARVAEDGSAPRPPMGQAEPSEEDRSCAGNEPGSTPAQVNPAPQVSYLWG